MTTVLDDELLSVLRGVNDPELGFNIVDLGLVYRAVRGGPSIEVAFTLTTPSCPLGEFLVDEVRRTVEQSFPDAADIKVELVWQPPWSPERMSGAARQMLG